jgi:hypothetical protein
LRGKKKRGKHCGDFLKNKAKKSKKKGPLKRAPAPEHGSSVESA